MLPWTFFMWDIYHMTLIVHVIHVPHDINCTCDTFVPCQYRSFNHVALIYSFYICLCLRVSMVIVHVIHVPHVIDCTCDTFTTWHWLYMWYMYHMTCDVTKVIQFGLRKAFELVVMLGTFFVIRVSTFVFSCDTFTTWH